MKAKILYTPQCPSNLFFIEIIKDIFSNYPIELEIINVHEEYEKVQKLIDESGIGKIQNLFIRVYIDEELIPVHPGNPEFRETLIKSLEERL
jgi:hypothetical protein